MDYHMDWLYAALYSQSHDNQPTIVDNSQGYIRGNQEDVDLLVSFERGAITHLVLLEAKGATSWSNKQMQSKADRLRLIFGEDVGKNFPDIEPHFLLTSPRRPRNLKTELWPQWMRRKEGPNWFELSNWPKNPVKVTRCGPEGRPNQFGKYWKLERTRH
jgi:hypothetical protein